MIDFEKKIKNKVAQRDLITLLQLIDLNKFIFLRRIQQDDDLVG